MTSTRDAVPHAPHARDARRRQCAARGDEHARKMETVSEKLRAARARASRALDDVDRSRATRALAVAVAIATLATLNPTPESFHAVCARGAHAGTSLAEKALPIRATRSWACSNGGFLRAVRLRREAFSVADLFVASIARVRDGSRAFLDVSGRGSPRPCALGPIATLAVDVYRVHATVFACAMLACVGTIALRALRAMKMLAMASPRAAAKRRASSRVRRAARRRRLVRRGMGRRVRDEKIRPSHSFSRRVRPETPRPSSSMNRAYNCNR